MKGKRGFATMTPERRKEIARKGAKAAHAKGVSHKWTSDEARLAGSKGGITVSKDRRHMQQIGRKGGAARSLKKLNTDGDGI